MDEEEIAVVVVVVVIVVEKDDCIRAANVANAACDAPPFRHFLFAREWKCWNADEAKNRGRPDMLLLFITMMVMMMTTPILSTKHGLEEEEDIFMI